MKGTVKSVDAKAGTVVLSADGKDMTLKADKSVDLGKLKAGEKVEATVDKDMLKSVKVECKSRRPQSAAKERESVIIERSRSAKGGSLFYFQQSHPRLSQQ